MIKQIPVKDLPESVKQKLLKMWGGVEPENFDTICFTYGDTCFTDTPLTKDLIKHESTHTRQQGNNPDEWWDKYIESKEFRYIQELEAYRNQYNYLKTIKGKIKSFNYAVFFAKAMSKPMYGDMCTFNKALQDILK